LLPELVQTWLRTGNIQLILSLCAWKLPSNSCDTTLYKCIKPEAKPTHMLRQ